jgi:hypothetical protein
MYEVSTAAFGMFSKRKIKKRAGGRSELSGQKSDWMHCSHINHDKSREDYNSPLNGMYITLAEHYAFHELHEGCADEIGLSERHNNRAVQGLRGQLRRKYNQIEYYEKIQEARDAWYDLWND